MNSFLQTNLLVAWVWMLCGFIGGAVLGMNFHKENWLGGYGSWKRRLYRLGHISFFGLGMINFMFYLTAKVALGSAPWIGCASSALVVGAITMPICCVLAAHFPKLRSLFAVPVSSMMAGALITILEVIKL